MSRYSSRSMDRLTASEHGHSTKATRPAAKRWSSAPVVSPPAEAFSDVPDFETDDAYKARATKKSNEYLTEASDVMREDLLMSLIRAYAHFGASLDAQEELMLDASRTFNVKVTVMRRHSAITCLIGERTSKRRYMRVVSPILPRSCFLGLLEVRRTYDAVVERSMRVTQARAKLANICTKTSTRYPFAHILFGAVLAGWVCLAVFGGALPDVLSSVASAFAVGLAHYFLQKVTPSGAEFVELLITISISLLAHDSHTPSVLISVLPGYLYTCAVLKRVNKYSVTQFVVAIFATIYTIALAFGLPIVIDLFLMTKLLALVFMVRKMWHVPTRPAVFSRDTTEKKAVV